MNNPQILVEDVPVPVGPGRLRLLATALLDCLIDLVLIVLFMFGLLAFRYFVLKVPVGSPDLLSQMKVPVLFASELPFALVGLWRLRRRGVLQGLLGNVNAKAIKEGLAAGIGFVLLSVSFVLLLRNVFGVSRIPDMVAQLFGNSSGWELIAMAMIIGIGAPLSEELFFRSNIFGNAFRSGRPWFGAIVSSCMFAVAHFIPQLAPYYFLVGLTLSWLYARNGGVLAPLVAHATLNTLACAGFLFLAYSK